jgi:hypothetical protein
MIMQCLYMAEDMPMSLPVVTLTGVAPTTQHSEIATVSLAATSGQGNDVIDCQVRAWVSRYSVPLTHITLDGSVLREYGETEPAPC